MNYMLMYIIYLSVLCGLSWTAVLPINEEEQQINQLQTTDNKQQQQQQQQQYKQMLPLIDSVPIQQRKPHQSYDTNDDVASIDIHAVNDDDDNEYIVNDGVAVDGAVDDDVDSLESQLPHVRQRRDLSDWLIAPNTRWCGRGNTANGTYNHLGGASSADKCCRKHDHCQLFIAGMSNRFELFNYRPYTLSHCNCDRRFRTCLKMANDEDATTIGKFFFNMVQTQCFILKNERICQQRAEDGSCEREYVKQKAYLRNNKKF